MKVDLRRLLAHLSGSVSPPAASEEAQELKSAASRRLLQRIRSIMSRRDLAIPLIPSGSAVDPNSIAEYLDGVLPSDRSTELEELCLASDKYLAEVAGCREILDKFPAYPTSPPPSALRRMYGLHKESGGGVLEQPGQSVARLSQRFRRVLTGVGVAMICAAIVYLGRERGVFDWHNSTVPNDPDVPSTSSDSEGKGEETLHADAKISIEPEASNPTNPKVPAKATTEPKTDPNRLGRFMAAAEKLPTILLRKQQNNSWQVVPPASSVSVNDYLLALPGFQSEIRFDSGIRVRLLGNWPIAPPGAEPLPFESTILDSATTLNPHAGVDLDLTLRRGRIAFANHKFQGEARICVRFGDEKWDLTLAEHGSEAALELVSFYPPGSPVQKDAIGEEAVTEVRLFALHGQIKLKVRYDSYTLHEPMGPAEFSWNNVGAISRRPQDLDRLPLWVTSQKLSDETHEALISFQTRLAGAPSVESALRDSMNNPDITTRVLAIYSLGATGDLASLLDALGNERQFAQVRLAAIIAIRNWMARDAVNDQKLFAALEKKYSVGIAEIVLQLLHGFSTAQLEKPDVYANLIGYLRNTNLPVRELAYLHLGMLVPKGRLIPYDPTGSRPQRERAFEEWKKLIPEGTVPKG